MHPIVNAARRQQRLEEKQAAKPVDTKAPMCVRCGKREAERKYDIFLCTSCIKELFGSDEE